MTWRIAVFAVLAVMPAHASEKKFTAQTLYSLCHPDTKEPSLNSEPGGNACATYMLGLTDGMFMMQELSGNSAAPCFGNTSVDVPKARQLFDEFLKNHPSAASYSAGLVVGMAVAEAYRCPK